MATALKFRKKDYDATTDAQAGVVTFDTSKQKIYVGGEEWINEFKGNGVDYSPVTTLTGVTLDQSIYKEKRTENTEIFVTATNTSTTPEWIFDYIMRDQNLADWGIDTSMISTNNGDKITISQLITMQSTGYSIKKKDTAAIVNTYMNGQMVLSDEYIKFTPDTFISVIISRGVTLSNTSEVPFTITYNDTEWQWQPSGTVTPETINPELIGITFVEGTTWTNGDFITIVAESSSFIEGNTYILYKSSTSSPSGIQINFDPNGGLQKFIDKLPCDYIYSSASTQGTVEFRGSYLEYAEIEGVGEWVAYINPKQYSENVNNLKSNDLDYYGINITNEPTSDGITIEVIGTAMVPKSGVVPAPTTSDNGKFLCSDGSWQKVDAMVWDTYEE